MNTETPAFTELMNCKTVYQWNRVIKRFNKEDRNMIEQSGLIVGVLGKDPVDSKGNCYKLPSAKLDEAKHQAIPRSIAN